MAMARPAETAVFVWYVCSVADVPTFNTEKEERRKWGNDANDTKKVVLSFIEYFSARKKGDSKFLWRKE